VIKLNKAALKKKGFTNCPEVIEGKLPGHVGSGGIDPDVRFARN
jgi:hypothetical protein